MQLRLTANSNYKTIGVTCAYYNVGRSWNWGNLEEHCTVSPFVSNADFHFFCAQDGILSTTDLKE